MDLAEYFENRKGTGILATASAEGEVDAALYGRPHVIDERTVAFIMRGRLSHQNVTSNPHAAYMFIEDTEGYVGKRLHLTRIREETDPTLIESMQRRQRPNHTEGDDAARYLVYFRVDRIRPLVGEVF